MINSKKTSLENLSWKMIFTAMLILLIFLFVLFTFIEINALREEMDFSIETFNKTAAAYVDNQFRKMDTMSINTIYSTGVRDTFSSYMAAKQNGTSIPKKNIEDENILYDFMYSIIGSNPNIKQINLYHINGGGFGAGLYNGFFAKDCSDCPWFNETIKNDGNIFVSQPYSENFFINRNKDGRKYISLCRTYFGSYNNIIGIVEIVQDYHSIFSIANSIDSRFQQKILVYDDTGNSLFSNDITDTSMNKFYEIYNESDTKLIKTKNNRDIIYYEKLPYTNFLLVSVVEFKNYIKPIQKLFLTILIVALIFSFICLLIAKNLSTKISYPLSAINDHLQKSDITSTEKLNKEIINKSNIIEINNLIDSIHEFQIKIQKTMEESLMFQRQSSQAQLQALQSQMNPHFLFNTLSTIKVMADEQMTEELSNMINDLSELLRYTLYETRSLVSLEEELGITDLYLSSMKYRFQNNLLYSINVPDAMLNIQIPKLCVQQLVENSIKHATKSSNPPWHISIDCSIQKQHWIIIVHDNGSGFDAKVAASMSKKIRMIQENRLLANLGEDGTGLVNLLYRIYLLYGDDGIFEFGNERGAYVKIGGKINGKSQVL